MEGSKLVVKPGGEVRSSLEAQLVQKSAVLKNFPEKSGKSNYQEPVAKIEKVQRLFLKKTGRALHSLLAS